MTLHQIQTASAEEVRVFINSLALECDITDPEAMNQLHAAKSRFMPIWAKKLSAELRGEVKS